MAINRDFIKELNGNVATLEPELVGPPVPQDYFTPPKKSSINQDFVDSLIAGEHKEVQDNKAVDEKKTYPPPTEFLRTKEVPEVLGGIKKVKRPRWEEARDASARGLAGMGSAGKQLISSFWAEPANIYGLKYPKASSQVKADTKRADKARDDAEFLWELSKNPALAAQNKDLTSRGLNLIMETLPYITATTAGYIAAGPMGGFAVGSMVEGNSAYRTALDNKVPEDKAKMIGVGVGVISGAIEAFGGKYAEDLLVKATSKLKNKVMAGGAIFGIGTVIEALEEGGQEIAQLTGESTYRDINWKEATSRILGSMAGGAFLGGVMKGGGVAVRKGIEQARTHQVPEMNETVKPSAAKVTPEKRTQAIDYVKGVLSQEQYATLDEKTKAEIGQRMLAEQGVKVEAEELVKTPPTEAKLAPEKPTEAISPEEAAKRPPEAKEEIAPVIEPEIGVKKEEVAGEVVEVAEEGKVGISELKDIRSRLDKAYKENDIGTVTRLKQKLRGLPIIDDATQFERNALLLELNRAVRKLEIEMEHKTEAQPPTVAEPEAAEAAEEADKGKVYLEESYKKAKAKFDEYLDSTKDITAQARQAFGGHISKGLKNRAQSALNKRDVLNTIQGRKKLYLDLSNLKVVDSKGNPNFDEINRLLGKMHLWADPVDKFDYHGLSFPDETPIGTKLEGIEHFIKRYANKREQKIVLEALAQPPAEPTAQEKQPWEMTKTEFNAERKRIVNLDKEKWQLTKREARITNPTLAVSKDLIDAHHKLDVQQALSEGKPIPREVLEEYKTEKWAQEALKEAPKAEKVVAPEAKEIKYEEKAITEPATEQVKPKGKAPISILGGIPKETPGLTKAEAEHLGKREQAALRAGQKRGYPIGYKMGAREIQEKMDTFKWQVREKVVDINKIRKEMFELVRENLPTYERGKVKVMALLKSITGQKTVEANRKKLDRAIEMVSKYAEEALQRSLRFQILKEVKKAKPKKKKGIWKGKYTADIQKTLTSIGAGLKANRDEARARIAENITKYENGLMDYVEMLNNNEMLSMVGIRGMASEELQHVLNTIKSLKETGKTIRQERRDKETARINEEKEKAIKVITGGKGLKPGAKSVPRGELEARKTFVEVVANWQYGWPNYLDKLSKFDKTSQMYESELSKFGDRVYEAFNEEVRGVSEQVEKLFENFQKIFSVKTPSQVSKILNEQKQKVDLGSFENADGEKIHLSLTKGQLIKKYMELKDFSLEETFTGGKTEEGKSWGMRWTDEIISAVNNALTAQEKAWGDYQMAYYREYYDSVNKVYRDIYGVDLPFNLFYSPIGRDIEADIPEVVLLAKEAMNYASTITGSLKSRTANRLPLKFNDANAVLINHIIGMEHFKAWSKPISDLRRMFMDKNIRQAIRQYHGKGILKQVDDLINQMAKGGVDKSKANKGIDFLRRNFTRAILGAKPVIGLKQIPSNLAYLTEMSLADYVNGIADFWKNPVSNAHFLADNSQYFKERWKAGHERDVKFAMKKGYAKVLAGKGNALDWFMAFIRAGDQFATMQGGWAKYKAEIKEKGKEKALLAAQKATEKTQPSFSTQSLSPLQRGGSWMKLMTMFQNQPNKYFRIIADNARNMRYGRQSKVKGISNLLIAWVILPCLFQMIADAFQFKNKHQLRAFLLGPINNLLVIGQMVNSIWGWLAGEVYDYEVSPVFSTSRDVQLAVTKSAKIGRDGMNPFKDIDMDDVIKAVEYYGQAAGKVSGLPTPYAVQAERSVRALATPKKDRQERAKDRMPGWRRSPMAELVFSPWALKSESKLKTMTDKELRQYRRDNTYQKTQYPKSKGIIKGRPHKGKEQLVAEINKLLKEKAE